MKIDRESGLPSLFVSRSTATVFAPGWETKRSPFGAYSIMRADCTSSANMLTVKPSGAFS
jgi:hypothetical protein